MSDGEILLYSNSCSLQSCIYTVSPKRPVLSFSISLPNINRFSKHGVVDRASSHGLFIEAAVRSNFPCLCYYYYYY